ncbi:MAG: polymer-forming cytoskeletal protein [Candidatus Magasanikbacteria bacterium]|jgi:cytoskeletal protein CcmA (bactofilin family)|nr:polymer-forming cytoskeletal protein [Candidatus Magasanikbacteria bacterium]
MFQKNTQQPQEQYVHEDVGRDEVETVVGPSVQVEGDFASEGNIIVKGTVSGSVKTSRLLRVEPGAKILANVKANEAIIAGQVKGDVRVLNTLELTETAQILGDITCSVLAVAAGALVEGKVSMKGIDIQDNKPIKRRGLSRIKQSTGEDDHDESESM